MFAAAAWIFLCAAPALRGQDVQRDRAIFVEPRPGFYEEMKAKAEGFKKKDLPGHLGDVLVLRGVLPVRDLPPYEEADQAF